MFQTGIHHFLQSWASDSLTWLMRWITSLGNDEVAMALIILAMFGFSLRRGFLLFQLVAWTALAGSMAKRAFGLPRPFFVDDGVQCLDPYFRTIPPMPGTGGREFWSLPSRDAVQAYRLARLSFGFPSGHSSGAVALWGGLALFFQPRILKWLAGLMIFLLVLTRLYLGVHFLADIFGGLALGGLMLWLAWRLWGRDWSMELIFGGRSGSWLMSPHMLYLFYLPLILLFLRILSPALAGYYLGVNSAYLLAARNGLPADEGSWPRRLLRVVLAGTLFVLGNLGAAELVEWVDGPMPSYAGRFLSTWLGTASSFGLSFLLLKRSGLYRTGSGR